MARVGGRAGLQQRRLKLLLEVGLQLLQPRVRLRQGRRAAAQPAGDPTLALALALGPAPNLGLDLAPTPTSTPLSASASACE